MCPGCFFRRKAQGMKTVELDLPSGLKVRVKPVAFSAWRSIRSSLISLLSDKIVAAVAAVSNGPLMTALRKELAAAETAKLTGVQAKADVGPLLQAALDELGKGTLEKIGDVLREVADSLADLSDDFVAGCVGGTLPEEISAIEFAMLREKAFEISNPVELLEREKNFVRGVGDVLVRLIGTSSAPRGGSVSNT